MLSDREKLIANWYVTMHSVIMGAMMGEINTKDLFLAGIKEMELYRVSHCPRVSAGEMREIHDDLKGFLGEMKSILEFNAKDKDILGV